MNVSIEMVIMMPMKMVHHHHFHHHDENDVTSSSWCHIMLHDNYGDKEVEAGDDGHLLASNPFLTQQGHCQAWSGQPACMPRPNWLKRFVEKSARSTKIHQFNIRAVDQISSVCDLFKVELNRIEKLDNSLLVWPIAKIQGMPKSEEEKNFKIWFKASPITEEIMDCNIFQCGC